MSEQELKTDSTLAGGGVSSFEIPSSDGDALATPGAAVSLGTGGGSPDDVAVDLVESLASGGPDPRDIMARFSTARAGQMMVRVSRLPNFYVDNRNDTTCTKTYLVTLAVTDDLENIIQSRFGPGAYRLEFRKSGLGQIEQTSLFEVAADEDLIEGNEAGEVSASVAVAPDIAGLDSLKQTMSLVAQIQKLVPKQPGVVEQLSEISGLVASLKELGIIPSEAAAGSSSSTGASWPDIVRDLVIGLKEAIPAIVFALRANNAGAAPPVGALPFYQPPVAPFHVPSPAPPAGNPLSDAAPVIDAPANGEDSFESFAAQAGVIGQVSADLVVAARDNVPVEDFATRVADLIEANPALEDMLTHVLNTPSDLLAASLPVADGGERLKVESYIQRLQGVIRSGMVASSNESAIIN